MTLINSMTAADGGVDDNASVANQATPPHHQQQPQQHTSPQQHVSASSADGSARTMLVRVRSVTGLEFDLSVPMNATVEDLKAYIAKRQTLGPLQQHLTFAARELISGKLIEYGVMHGSTLTLAPSMRCGPSRLKVPPPVIEQSMVYESLKRLTEQQLETLFDKQQPITISALIANQIVVFTVMPVQDEAAALEASAVATAAGAVTLPPTPLARNRSSSTSSLPSWRPQRSSTISSRHHSQPGDVSRQPEERSVDAASVESPSRLPRRRSHHLSRHSHRRSHVHSPSFPGHQARANDVIQQHHQREQLPSNNNWAKSEVTSSVSSSSSSSSSSSPSSSSSSSSSQTQLWRDLPSTKNWHGHNNHVASESSSSTVVSTTSSLTQYEVNMEQEEFPSSLMATTIASGAYDDMEWEPEQPVKAVAVDRSQSERMRLHIKMDMITEQLKQKRLSRLPIESPSISSPSSSSSHQEQPSTCIIDQEITLDSPSSSSNIASSSTTSTVSIVNSSSSSSSSSSTKNRCSKCQRKLGIVSQYTCRCSLLFCSAHHHSNDHDCTFDYKALGRHQLAQSNPCVRQQKV